MNIISCKTILIVILLFSHNLSATEEISKPIATTEDFSKWIVGTEWKCTEFRKGKKIRVVRRFYPKKVMMIQEHTQQWTPGKPIVKLKYDVMSRNILQYGTFKWAATFAKDEDEDHYTEFRAVSNSFKNQRPSLGSYMGRFKYE